jgi:hypothetical protein
MRRLGFPGFTFPAALVYPPQTQLARAEDAVGTRVTQLDLHAQRLGEGFGISLTNFSLNSLPKIVDDSIAAAVVGMLGALVHREDRISLER